jgi:hypothetical protein
MATSPTAATSPDTDTNNLSPKDFGAKLDQIVKHHNNLLKLAAKVYSLGKTQRLQYPNGQTIGRKEIRTLSSQLGKEIKSLRKNYTAHGKKKKRKKREGGSAGFKNPILVSDSMREFFSQANLGPSDPSNPNSAPLSSVLAVGQNGVTTRAIMTPLFNIYAHVNQMQKDPENKQFLTATPQMNQYFQDTYARLAARPQKYQKDKETGRPDPTKPIPKFDPNRFRYASIQSIVADNTRPKDASSPQASHLALLTPEEEAVLEDPATKQRLAQEQDLVSGILSVYREQKKAAAKAAKGM